MVDFGYVSSYVEATEFFKTYKHLKNVKTTYETTQSHCKIRLGLMFYHWQRLRDYLKIYLLEKC